MARFEYRVETITLDQPSSGDKILRYEKREPTGTTLPSIDELGQDGWELFYIDNLRSGEYFAIFKREVH